MAVGKTYTSIDVNATVSFVTPINIKVFRLPAGHGSDFPYDLQLDLLHLHSPAFYQSQNKVVAHIGPFGCTDHHHERPFNIISLGRFTPFYEILTAYQSLGSEKQRQQIVDMSQVQPGSIYLDGLVVGVGPLNGTRGGF